MNCFSGIMMILSFAMSTACLGASTNPDNAEKGVTGNVLIKPWAGPYGGVPAFDQLELSQLRDALEIAMAAWDEEIDAITSNPDPATFDNTIVPLEKAGSVYQRVSIYQAIWARNLSSPEFREIQQEMAPRLSEFRSGIDQNSALFKRVKTLYTAPGRASLSPPQQRLLHLTHEDFARNGADLSSADKVRHTAINKRLSELQIRFSNNVLADEEKYVHYLDKTQLGGLPKTFIESAAVAAEERAQPGKYAITNTRSSVEPFLRFSSVRRLRETAWRTFYARGDNGDANDNNAVIVEILRLRAERSQLVGYDSYADWALGSRMARNPQEVIDLLETVLAAALEQVDRDLVEMQKLATVDNIVIEAWDYRYYAERIRTDLFDLDAAQLQQYLQLDKLLEAVFFVAGEVFQFEFNSVPVNSVPVFHQDVRVWEVTHRKSGAHIGLFYLDPFARAGKRSGAWAVEYRKHSKLDGNVSVLASNNSNFIKGQPGEPVVLSWDDAVTLFHEFGHALHGLSSKVTYPGLNSIVWDYIEFPSQLLERWLLTDEVMNRYLVHHKTGEPMPQTLANEMLRAANFNQGLKQAEYISAALIDMKYHVANPLNINPDRFEREQMASLGMPAQITMRHRSTQFSHSFSSESYAASYYGYLWADILTADAAEAFEQAPGGYYDSELSRRLVRSIFSVSNSVEPGQAYRNFRGRDARVDAAMKSYGFAPVIPETAPQ